MKATYHIEQRMNHRGINKALIDCVVEFGEIKKDKYVINQRLANFYIQQIQRELSKRKH
nr:hypothetical protein [uncultured Haemophilus sp.]